MEFEDVIRKRTSIRKYSSKKVEKEKLDKILEAGRVAPTAKNFYPVKIYAVTSDDGIKKIDNASPCRYGASCVLIICGNKEEAFRKVGFSSYEMDATIVTTHMMLEATNLGVDNTWIEMFDSELLRQEFSIDEDFEIVALLDLGYRAEGVGKSPMHDNRKNIEEIVEYK